MDLELTPDQRALQDGIATFCQGRYPMPRVRQLAEQGGVDRDGWAELGTLGVFSMRVPERDGGVGLDMAASVLVFEQLGRRLVPGPLVATELATAARLVEAGEVGGLIDGRRAPVFVEYLPTLDTLLVLDDEGVWSVAPEDLVARAVERPLDPLAPLHRVVELSQGERVADAATAARLRTEGAVLTAAYLVGAARAATDLAVAHAQQREQFGRPIGSFQAVKHILADMHVRVEVAQAAVYAAGVAMAEDRDEGGVGPGVARAASVAKVLAGEAAIRNGKAAIQVHGGMGYTWEVDAHLYLKRAWYLDTMFGSIDDHADRLAHSADHRASPLPNS